MVVETRVAFCTSISLLNEELTFKLKFPEVPVEDSGLIVVGKDSVKNNAE